MPRCYQYWTVEEDQYLLDHYNPRLEAWERADPKPTLTWTTLDKEASQFLQTKGYTRDAISCSNRFKKLQDLNSREGENEETEVQEPTLPPPPQAWSKEEDICFGLLVKGQRLMKPHQSDEQYWTTVTEKHLRDNKYKRSWEECKARWETTDWGLNRWNYDIREGVLGLDLLGSLHELHEDAINERIYLTKELDIVRDRIEKVKEHDLGGRGQAKFRVIMERNDGLEQLYQENEQRKAQYKSRIDSLGNTQS